MEILIGPEQPANYREVENLTREAFWNLHGDGANEHLLVHNLRKTDIFVPELDMVATKDGRIVGNIMYSKAVVEAPDKTRQEVLTLGPLSVLPAYKNHGIGSELVWHTLALAKEMGHKGVVIFGHPGYYPRFGFENARRFGITTHEGENIDAFMALELQPGAMEGIQGRYCLHPVFEIDEQELAKFEESFPKKKALASPKR